MPTGEMDYQDLRVATKEATYLKLRPPRSFSTANCNKLTLRGEREVKLPLDCTNHTKMSASNWMAFCLELRPPHSIFIAKSSAVHLERHIRIPSPNIEIPSCVMLGHAGEAGVQPTTDPLRSSILETLSLSLSLTAKQTENPTNHSNPKLENNKGFYSKAHRSYTKSDVCSCDILCFEL